MKARWLCVLSGGRAPEWSVYPVEALPERYTRETGDPQAFVTGLSKAFPGEAFVLLGDEEMAFLRGKSESLSDLLDEVVIVRGTAVALPSVTDRAEIESKGA